MKKFFYLLICLTLAACGGGGGGETTISSSNTSGGSSGIKVTVQSILSQMDHGRYVQGELLVKFKPGMAAASRQKIHQAVGASVISKHSLVPNLERIKLPEGVSIGEAVAQYMSDADVEYAEPNYIVRAAFLNFIIPNDTYFNDQWALRNTGTYANGTYAADMKAAFAWNFSVGSHDIRIAVLDTGIDYNHPDLAGNMWSGIGRNFVTCAKFEQNSNPEIPGVTCETPSVPGDDPMEALDDNGHGTHVAGIIGAAGNNNLGVAGVMWNVSLMAVKVLNADGEGSWWDVINGIQFAVNNGARVMNASFGGYYLPPDASCGDIAIANPAGILLVAAAGNDGSNNDLTPFYPASCDLPYIISVAATDQNDDLVALSNFGPNSVDIAAPGTYIISTVPNAAYDTLEFMSGTSMAAPFVSGVAGLLMSYYDGHTNTYFTPAQIRDTILGFNDKEENGYPGLKTLKGKIKTGGRLDALWEIASLATPSNVVAQAKTLDLVLVTWSDNSIGEDIFELERSTDGTNFSLLTNLPANTTSFTDKNVSEGTNYFYRIRASNWIGKSFYAYAPPTGIPATHHSDGGGGGCSVGGKQNVPTAVADVVVLLIPVAIVALVRRRG